MAIHRVSSSLAAGSILLAFFGLGISACLQTKGQRRADLERRVHEILPTSARVLELGFGDCVELAPSPSCVGAVFELSIEDSGERAALVRAHALENGWTVRDSGDAEGGWSLSLKRGPFVATVFLWRPEVYGARCGEGSGPIEEEVCFNKVSVTRTG